MKVNINVDNIQNKIANNNSEGEKIKFERKKTMFEDKNETNIGNMQHNQTNTLNTGNNSKENPIEKEDYFSKSKNEIVNNSGNIEFYMSKLDSIVNEKEKQRNYKLVCDFDKERTNLENEQVKVRDQIEELSKRNVNEKNIKMIKEEKSKQQDLFNKYYKINSETVAKINKYNDNLPFLQDKIKEKQKTLKDLNHENLELLQKIQNMKLEKLKEYKDFMNNVKNNESINIKNKGNSSINANSVNQSKSAIHLKDSFNESAMNVINKEEKLKYTEYGKVDNIANKSIINKSTILKKNEYLKNKEKELLQKRKKFKEVQKENMVLSNEISSINSQIFFLSKIFSEGMHEIGVYLRKVHEVQLDKIVPKKSYGNSLYFELVKDKYPSNLSGHYQPIQNEIKLPIIHSKIRNDYKFPLVEKSEPKYLIYNVIKTMIEEHQFLNRHMIVKKEKIPWEEFVNYSSLQVFTVLCLNVEVIKEIEKLIFPKGLSYINKGNDKVFDKINEEDISDNEIEIED